MPMGGEVALSHIQTQLYYSVPLFPCSQGFSFPKKENKNAVENYKILLHINLIKITATINPELRWTHFPGLACSSDHV